MTYWVTELLSDRPGSGDAYASKKSKKVCIIIINWKGVAHGLLRNLWIMKKVLAKGSGKIEDLYDRELVEISIISWRFYIDS